MKAYLSAWFKVVVFLFGTFMTTPLMMAENTIDFSKGTNLKTVYDAGLRPWRVRQDEISNLHVAEQNVRVIAPNGGSFTMDVQIGDFGVLAENQLSKADFISQPMPLDRAIKQAKAAAQALGIDVARGDGMGGLDQKASEFFALGDQTPSPQSWRGQSEINGVRYGVTLNPLFGLNETRGKVYVTLDFYERGKPMKFLTEPIKPPPGYEHLSMAPPETNPSKLFPNPEYSFENMVKRVEAAKAAEGRPSTPAMTPSPTAPTATPKAAPAVQLESSKSFPRLWIISAILLLAVVGGILLKLRGK